MPRFTLCGLALATLLGCTNTPKNTDGTMSSPSEVEKSAGPDGSDLLRTLQGKWQSERDPSYVIEFADTRMIHTNSGRVTYESEIEIDVLCQSKVCTADSTDLSEGWCFTERSGSELQCNCVLICDKTTLSYIAIGAAGGNLNFRRAQ
jgi:hypothetical protein